LKKPFRPHHACRTITPWPLPEAGVAKEPVTIRFPAENSTIATTPAHSLLQRYCIIIAEFAGRGDMPRRRI
jgi:hypothetical protein